MSKRKSKTLQPLTPTRRHYKKYILEAYKVEDTDAVDPCYTFELLASKHDVLQLEYANYYNKKFDFEKRISISKEEWIRDREEMLLPIWIYIVEGRVRFGDFLLRMKDISNTEMKIALEDHADKIENKEDIENSLLFQLVQRKVYAKLNRDEHQYSETLAREGRRNNPPGIPGQGQFSKGYDRRPIKDPRKGRRS